MPRRFFLAVLLAATLLAACETRLTDADRDLVRAVLTDVRREYQKPWFVEEMAARKSPLDALQYALDVQAGVCALHDVTFEQYLIRLREAKRDPDINAMLDEVKALIRANQGFSERFLNAVDTFGAKGAGLSEP